MPYEWQRPSPDRAELRLQLWPYRSLPRRGFVGFIAATAVLIATPLLVALGSPVLWGMLPFLALALAAVWFALERSYRDGAVIEELRLTGQSISLTRIGPGHQRQDWQANPYWVRLECHPKGGPLGAEIAHYLTLAGEGRTVELGAFLTPEERLLLAGELRQKLDLLRQTGSPLPPKP